MKVWRNTKPFLVFLALLVFASFAFSLLLPVTAQEVLPLFVKEEKAPKAPRPLYVPDEIIVKFKPGINENSIKGLEQAQGVLEKYISPFAKFRVLKIPQGKLVTEMVEIFKKNPLVEYAEPNYYAYATMVPNDPGYQYQWHFDNATYGGIQMEQGWDISTGTPSVIVAVVDTGVAYEDYPTEKYWHLDTYNAYGGSGYSWWCGVTENPNWATPPGYSNYWEQYLIHEFDLTLATGDVTLSFRHKYDVERNYDFCYVEVSDNNGSSWTGLASYTGNSRVWKQVKALDLTAYKGKTILLRFRFNSDYTFSDGDGDYDSDGAWYIDEVKITDDSGTLFYNNMESGVGDWQVDSLPFQKAPDLANTNFVSGDDFIDSDSHPNDDDSHGTHVAGTVAQSTNNYLGVAGVAFNTTIMPVKVLGPAGGTYQQVADGIYYATNNGARVINMSLGGDSASTVLEDAVAYAYNYNNGVTVIAACGNSNASSCDYPAAYDAYVIAVGATQYDETKAPYSNYGPSLDIVAPGGNTGIDQNGDGYTDGVLQNTFGDTLQDWGYYFFQGTSMAAPHVSGLAALILALKPEFTPDEVRNALESTAEDLGAAGRDDTYGWGLIDAQAALSYSPVAISVVANDIFDYDILPLSPSAESPTTQNTITLGTTPIIQNTGGVAVDLAVKSSDAVDGTTWELVAAGSIAADNYCHQYSTDSGTNWADFPTNNDYTGVIVSGLGANDSIPLDLQILMPTGSTDSAEKSINVTILATSP